MLENGLLKIAAAQAAGAAVPLGLAAMTVLLIRSHRDRRRLKALRAQTRTNTSSPAVKPMPEMHHPGDQWPADLTHPSPMRAPSGADGASPRDDDRRVLLSRVIEDNLRLREAVAAQSTRPARHT